MVPTRASAFKKIQRIQIMTHTAKLPAVFASKKRDAMPVENPLNCPDDDPSAACPP